MKHNTPLHRMMCGAAVAIAMAAGGSSGQAEEAPATPCKPPAQRCGDGVVGVPEGWQLASAAQYAASQSPAEVTIKATGENPTAGYETKLVVAPVRCWPPQYLLVVKKPDGIVAEVVTPFSVTASFKTDKPVQAVTIVDGAGKHEVKVGQPKGTATDRLRNPSPRT